MLMTVRERLVSVKSQLSNAFRSYAAEFGIIGPAGRQNVNALIKRVLEDESLPELARDLFRFWPAPIWWPGSNLMHGGLSGHG